MYVGEVLFSLWWDAVFCMARRQSGILGGAQATAAPSLDWKEDQRTKTRFLTF